MLKHLRDIESDLSAFHRIDDIWDMDGPRFFRLAYRLTAYKGVLRALAERQESKQQDGKRNGGRGTDRTVVPVASGELGRIEGLGHGITENRQDGLPWLSIEKATG